MLRNPVVQFAFSNADSRDNSKISAAFLSQGLHVAVVEQHHLMWVYVLTEEGHLYLLDKSHGGGGFFTLCSLARR